MRGSHEYTAQMDINKKLFAFFQHGTTLYSWRKLGKNKLTQEKQLSFVSNTSLYSFKYFDDNTFFFMHNTEPDDKH